MRVQDRDRRLLARIDGRFARVAARAGAWLACRPGCDSCCRDPFPITRLDARRLRDGFQALAEKGDDSAAGIEQRARRWVADLPEDFPIDAAGRLTDRLEQLDPALEALRGRACPVLEPETGTCGLYESRPIACRTFGPPQRFDGRDSPACELCFSGADPATIESCRLEADPEGEEQRLNEALGAAPDEAWATTIAHALLRPPRGLR